MANHHPLLVEFDCVEPRVQSGRLMVAGDGTSWDLSSASNVWLDPSTLTLMLAPLPTTAEWRTTFTGDYARYTTASYTLTTPTKWKQMQIKATGDYFLQSLDVTERVSTAAAVGTNQAMYLSLYVPTLKDLDDAIILKCGWGVGSAGAVELWASANGKFQVLKNGVVVGQYSGGGETPVTATPSTSSAKSPGNEFMSIMMIPGRNRELMVTTNIGAVFSHTFTDLDPNTANTITPNAAFSWLVPAGQASVQCAPVKFKTSGYIHSPVKSLRYPPATGAAFANTSAYGTIGSGSPSGAFTVVKSDGTAYTPDGIVKDVRLKVALTGSGAGTLGVYAIDITTDAPVSATYSGAVNVTNAIKSLNLSVGEDGRATVKISAHRKWLADAGVQQPQITTDRPIRIALSDGAVTPTYIDVFRGTLASPKITYFTADQTANKDYSLLDFDGQDRSRDLDLTYIVESLPYDGFTLSNAIADLLKQAGFTSAGDRDIDSTSFVFPYTPAVSQGKYTLAPDYGDTVGGFLEKIRTDFFATWVSGWFPSTGGYRYTFRDVNSLGTSPVVDLYLTTAGATTAGVTGDLAWKRTVRSMTAHYELPEATSVTVKGQDPQSAVLYTKSNADASAELAATPPASRPANWRGRPCLYELRDPALTTQAAVDQAANILYTRLTSGRVLVEFDADFLVLTSNNRPVWLTDVVRIYEADGTTVRGNYRIIAIPSVEFVTERGTGLSLRRATYRGVLV